MYVSNISKILDLILSCGAQDMKAFIENGAKNATYKSRAAVVDLICTTEALQIKGTPSSTNPVRLLPLSKQYCSSSSIIHIVVYGTITQHKNSGQCLSAESAHHTLWYKYS